MNSERHGCKYCFETLHHDDPRPSHSTFFRCSGCGALYHTACWIAAGSCCRCDGAEVEVEQISAPPPLVGHRVATVHSEIRRRRFALWAILGTIATMVAIVILAIAFPSRPDTSERSQGNEDPSFSMENVPEVDVDPTRRAIDQVNRCIATSARLLEITRIVAIVEGRIDLNSDDIVRQNEWSKRLKQNRSKQEPALTAYLAEVTTGGELESAFVEDALRVAQHVRANSTPGELHALRLAGDHLRLAIADSLPARSTILLDFENACLDY